MWGQPASAFRVSPVFHSIGILRTNLVELRSTGQPRAAVPTKAKSKSLRSEVGLLPAAYAYIFESQGAQAGGVEQVLGVDNDGLFEQVLDLLEIQGAELGPAGADHQCVGTFGSGVGRFAIAYRPVKPYFRFGNRDRIVGADMRTFGNKIFRQPDRRRSRHGICIWLEGKAQNADFLVLD